MKKIAFRVVAVTLALGTAALLVELGFRISGLLDENRGLKNSIGGIHNKYFHRFRPNSRFRLVASKNDEYDVAVSINNFSFRGKDISRDKKPGTTRIIAIGDSFTFGVGAEEHETIPFLMEKYLNDDGRSVELINAGFGSDSPLLHYLRTKDEYLGFEPDMALYFFDFSDLADDWKYEKCLVYDERGNIIRCDPAFANGKRDWWKTLRIHSKLCVFIHNKVVRLIGKIRALGFRNYVKAKMDGKRAKALIVAKQGETGEFDPLEYDAYLMIRGRDRLPEITRHFKRTEKYLNLLRDTLKQEGIPMILVVYPYGIHVGPGQWGEGRIYWGFQEGVLYDDYYVFDLLEDYARRNDIPYINVLPAFIENRDKKLFFDIDGHFTPVANRITAEAIVKNETFLNTIKNLPK